MKKISNCYPLQYYNMPRLKSDTAVYRTLRWWDHISNLMVNGEHLWNLLLNCCFYSIQCTMGSALKELVSKRIGQNDYLSYSHSLSESQKPRQRVSIAVRKVFAKIRKVFAIRWILILSAHIHTKTVWITRKLSGQPQNCPDNPKTFRTIQKPSGHSRNCPDNLEMSG